MKDLVKRWNEVFLIVLLTLCWPISAHVIRMLSGDQTAFPFDAGVLHTIYVSMIVIASLWLFTYVGVRLSWPLLWRYNEGFNYPYCFSADFSNLNSNQRIWVFVAFYSVLLLCSALVFMAVAGLA